MKKLFFLICSGSFLFSTAQVSLPVPVNIKWLYDKGTRSMDGRPGKNYWQNHAAYTIDVTFTPGTR
ncbi:MAG TPA: hypothetical protein VK498_01640, partial [Ferruginibacter sp.]|nr:hypothetical protein [Ferruginibacter sp.]